MEFLPHFPAGRDVIVLGNETPAVYFFSPTAGVLRKTDALFAYAYDWAVSPDRTKVLAAARSATGNLQLIDLVVPGRVAAMAARLEGARLALDSDPHDGGALRTFGEWYALRQVWRPAADLLGRARAAGADVPPALLARCYLNSAQYDKVLPELARAADEEPSPTAAAAWRKWHDDLAADGVDAGRQAELQQMEAWLSHPCFVLARRHAGMGRWKQALQLTVAAAPAQLLPVADGYEFLFVQRGLLDFGYLAESKKVLLAELAARPDDASNTVLQRLGHTCYQLGDFEEAARWLGRVTGAGASQPLWNRIQGDALWRLKRRDEAVAAWRRALEAWEAGQERPAALESLPRDIQGRLDAVKNGGEPAVQKTAAEIKAERDARQRVH